MKPRIYYVRPESEEDLFLGAIWALACLHRRVKNNKPKSSRMGAGLFFICCAFLDDWPQFGTIFCPCAMTLFGLPIVVTFID